jgi:hypothetical protein
MTMPDIIKRANAVSNELICRHGCMQAQRIARKAYEKITAAYEAQQRKEDNV